MIGQWNFSKLNKKPYICQIKMFFINESNLLILITTQLFLEEPSSRDYLKRVIKYFKTECLFFSPSVTATLKGVTDCYSFALA